MVWNSGNSVETQSQLGQLSTLVWLYVTHHLCPYHSRPPQACRPVMALLCRDLISSPHCSRWKHSLWGSSSRAESLREENVRQSRAGVIQQWEFGALWWEIIARESACTVCFWGCVPGCRASWALISGLGRTMLIKHPGLLFTLSTVRVRLWSWF